MRLAGGLGTGLCTIALIIALAACEREQRQFRGAPWATSKSGAVRVGALLPGSPLKPPYEHNAYAIAEGERLYAWFNCVGCHGHGGGGIGPPLMGALIHGHESATIFAVIVGGTPNGMPAFGDKIPDDQVWQLVAYVQSLSGLVAPDAAPARGDHLQVRLPASPPNTTRAHTRLEEMRAAEDAVLHSYGWVDQAAGIVRVPIERAMELLAERGLPARAQAPERPASPNTSEPLR